MAGSLELGRATAEAISRRNLVIWQFHGICGCGRNLDEAYGRIDVLKDYDVRTYPLFVLIDKDGKIYKYPSRQPSDGLEADLQKILEQ
jgi:cytochrome oxidase Cu insertion factor (SCO1/SenC/PrrC family)